MKITETQIIDKVLNGETERFAYFLDTYSDQVFRLIVQIINTREDAEELTQDTFIKAFTKLNSFNRDAKFSTWLYRIAYNNAISATRKQKQEYLCQEEDQIYRLADEADDSFFDQTDNEELVEKLEQAIEQLDEDERGLFTLFYYEGHSVAEIAEITSSTQTNTKTKLHRIRKKLHQIIQSL
ncbi:RNA polymerase sigma factor [Porphyromonadaceae bacterium]